MHSAVRPEKAGRKELQGQKRLGEAAKRREKEQKEKAEKGKKLR